MDLKDYQKEFITHLYRSGAIKFGKFKLKSGRISPYFINLAVAMNDGEGVLKTANAYVNAIADVVGLDFTYIHGPAYKGIPLSSVIALKLFEKFKVNVRWGYNRKEAKDYGDLSEKRIVGDLRDGDVVLIVDDVITTGLTKVESWRVLTAFRSVKPKGIIIAVDREELSQEDRDVLDEHGLSIYSVVKISDVFRYLYECGYLSGEELEVCEGYLEKT
jgi:orotate phosphoribosyltransferase